MAQVHSKGRTIKGINILNALYHVNDVSVPVAFEIIHKPILYCDIKTRKIKRESNVTKNDLLRNILTTCQKNQLNYRYVLTDIWYASTENMQHIKNIASSILDKNMKNLLDILLLD